MFGVPLPGFGSVRKNVAFVWRDKGTHVLEHLVGEVNRLVHELAMMDA